MALYTRDSIERLRGAVDMIELVGTKTDLRRVGTQWMGLCPFHDERTPSLSVNAEAKVFHCFGCGVEGDAFGFVQQSEGVTFREAVELLAGDYGVQLEPEGRVEQTERRQRRVQRPVPSRNHDISPERVARARSGITRYVEHCHGRLSEPKAYPARRWLYARGLTDAEHIAHQIGFDPGYRALGRASRSPPSVTLPLFDENGAVTYVQGRVIEPASQTPKFLNPNGNWIGPSPRISAMPTHPMADHSVLVVCEGVCDGILAARHFDARALIGARQPDEAVVERLLDAAHGRPVIVCLDSDRAGWGGAKNLLELIAERGAQGAYVPLPAGDLTDLVLDARDGFEGVFRSLVQTAADQARAGRSQDPADRSSLDPVAEFGHLLGLKRIAALQRRIDERAGGATSLAEPNAPFEALDPNDALETLRLERRTSVLTGMLRRDRKELAELGKRQDDDLVQTVQALISDGESELAEIARRRGELRRDGRDWDTWFEQNLDQVADWVAAERVVRGVTEPALYCRPPQLEQLDSFEAVLGLDR